MNMNSFEDQYKKLMSEWTQRLEEFKNQFASGKGDASEAFEKQKEHFRTMVTGLKENMEKAGEMSEEMMKTMKAKLEELRLQLNLGKADGMDAFEEQKKKIEAALHEVNVEGKKIFGKSFEHLLELFDTNAQAFKTGLEILKLQFALGKTDGKDESEKVKKDIQAKMEEMQATFQKMQEMGKQNLEEWNKAMKEGYDKFKSFFETKSK